MVCRRRHPEPRRPAACARGAQPLLWCGYQSMPSQRCSVSLLPTILADLSLSKPQRDHLNPLLPLLAGLPVPPMHRNLARLGGRRPHTHSRQAARPCDFATFNLADLMRWCPTHTTWPGPGTALSCPSAAASCPGWAGAGTTARGGWSGASSWRSCPSWTWTRTVRISSTGACIMHSCTTDLSRNCCGGFRPGGRRRSRGRPAHEPLQHRPGDGPGSGLPYLPRPLPDRVQLPRCQAAPGPSCLPGPSPIHF